MDESPMVTALHESGHILHGHTEPERMKEYLHHRGLYDLTFIRLAGCWVECGVG
jgi:hypothetical protein